MEEEEAVEGAAVEGAPAEDDDDEGEEDMTRLGMLAAKMLTLADWRLYMRRSRGETCGGGGFTPSLRT